MIEQILNSEIGYLLSFTKDFYGNLYVEIKFPHWQRSNRFSVKGNLAKFLYWEFFSLLFSYSVGDKKAIYKSMKILSEIIKSNNE